MIKDLFPVGLIYFIIIGSGIHLKQSYDLFHQKEETRYAMKVAIDIDKDFKKSKEATSSSIDYLIKENIRLNNKLSEYKHVDSIVKDIHRIAE